MSLISALLARLSVDNVRQEASEEMSLTWVSERLSSVNDTEQTAKEEMSATSVLEMLSVDNEEQEAREDIWLTSRA